MHDLDLELQFPRITDERDHDFRPHLFALLLHRGGGFKNSARLHLGNFWINNPKPAAAVAEHRIELVQLAHAADDVFHRHADLSREIELLLLFVREKFVQRRIEKTNRRRQSVERPENADEILALIRQQLAQAL